MTEAEKLARTIRRLIHGAVGLVLIVVVGLAGSVAVRWGWDAATTSRDERLTACAKSADERRGPPKGGGAFAPYSQLGILRLACSEANGDVDEALRVMERGGIITGSPRD